MKKYLCYLADILTLIRIILAGVLISLAFSHNASIGMGFLVFFFAEMTDAFDGYCSRRWKYKKGAEPWFRKYAVKYDMFADVFLWFAMVLFFTFQVELWVGLVLAEVTLLGCGALEIVIYGKLFGHPDNCLDFSLCKRNFPLAKKMIMMRRGYYLMTVVFMAIWTLFATEWELWVKIVFLILGISFCVFLWFFLETRRKNVSRDAIGLEKKMLKEQSKTRKKKSKTPKAHK